MGFKVGKKLSITLFILAVLVLCVMNFEKPAATPVKLTLHSDLHEESRQTASVIDALQADVVILAGDVNNGSASLEYADALAKKCNKPVILVAGNHEYYGHNLEDMEKLLRAESAKRKNVYFLERDALVLHGVRFLGCTLWTNFKLYEKQLPGQSEVFMEFAHDTINDFRKIKTDNRLITGTDIIKLHEHSVQWLKEQLAKPHSGPTVVITHFAPVPGCFDEKWADNSSLYNEFAPYFINDLESLIINEQPDVWVYGHTHSNINFSLGKTQILSNQKGYVSEKTGPEPYQEEWLLSLDKRSK